MSEGMAARDRGLGNAEEWGERQRDARGMQERHAETKARKGDSGTARGVGMEREQRGVRSGKVAVATRTRVAGGADADAGEQ